MTRATRFILQAAKRVQDSGATVHVDRRFPTVLIACQGEDDIFMQGDEAGQFEAEVDAMCKRYPSLDRQTAAYALAEPYTDTWS